METLINAIGELIKSGIDNIIAFMLSIINNILIGISSLFLPLYNTQLEYIFSVQNVATIIAGLLANNYVNKTIYYFQIIATALLILKGFWDLLDNYVFLSGQSTTKSATNKIMTYIFSGVVVWIIPEVVEILIIGTLKILEDLINTFENFQIISLIGEGNNLFEIFYNENLLETIPKFIAIIIVILGTTYIIVQIFIRLAKIMLLTIFLVPASVDLSSGSNGVFTKTMFSIISQLLAICFQYILLAIFVYIMISPNINIPEIGLEKLGSRTLMGIGLIIASIQSPAVLSDILDGAGAGSSVAGFVKSFRTGMKSN